MKLTKKSLDIPSQHCPHCGYKYDMTRQAVFGEEQEMAPRPGDASLCAACGRIALFATGLKLRKPTHDEQLTLNVDPRIVQMQIFWSAEPHPKPPRKK